MKNAQFPLTTCSICLGFFLVTAICSLSRADAAEMTDNVVRPDGWLYPEYQLSREFLSAAVVNDRVDLKRTPQEIELKSRLSSGLLGGLVGYGSGQFYSKSWISGTAFLILDGLSTVMVAGGIVAMISADDQGNGAEDWEGLLQAGGGFFLVCYGTLALLGSHAVQAVVGPVCTHRYNKKILGQKAKKLTASVRPGVDSVAINLSFNF